MNNLIHKLSWMEDSNVGRASEIASEVYNNFLDEIQNAPHISEGRNDTISIYEDTINDIWDVEILIYLNNESGGTIENVYAYISTERSENIDALQRACGMLHLSSTGVDSNSIQIDPSSYLPIKQVKKSGDVQLKQDLEKLFSILFDKSITSSLKCSWMENPDTEDRILHEDTDNWDEDIEENGFVISRLGEIWFMSASIDIKCNTEDTDFFNSMMDNALGEYGVNPGEFKDVLREGHRQYNAAILPNLQKLFARYGGSVRLMRDGLGEEDDGQSTFAVFHANIPKFQEDYPTDDALEDLVDRIAENEDI